MLRIYQGVILSCLVVAGNSAFAQVWIQTAAPTNVWAAIASSADGSRLAALATQTCYISTNSGTTWTSNNFSASGSVLAASADGLHLVSAQSNTGEIDVSTNGGGNWAKSTNYIEAAWFSIASSADGKKLVLTEGGPLVRASTNSGATWYSLASLPNSGSQGQFAAMSADGTHVVVAINNKCICSTTNFGSNWLTNNLSIPCEAIAASADGLHFAIAPYGGNIYTSSDSGVTWTQQTNSPNALWWSIASSADGARLVAVSGSATVGGAGSVYTSMDFGSTWISNSAPSQPWQRVASSADGNQLAATVYGVSPVFRGGIWISQTTPSPQLNVSLFNNNLNLSWLVPSANFVLQEASDLNAENWTAVTNLPTLNLTNLQKQLTLPPTNSSAFFRLTSQ